MASYGACKVDYECVPPGGDSAFASHKRRHPPPAASPTVVAYRFLPCATIRTASRHDSSPIFAAGVGPGAGAGSRDVRRYYEL
jgi:hypothetical protein